jgi:penicillin-binding protein activator
MRLELNMPHRPLAVLVTALALAACSAPKAFTKGEYSDPNQIDMLSDQWNQNDLQLVAKKMVESLTASPAFAQIQGQPLLVISRLRNSTSEHIDMASLGDMIQTDLQKTGKFAFQDKAARQDVAEEYEYQQSGYVNPGQAKGPGQQASADYVMTGDLASIVQEVGSNKEVYYKMTLKLTNLRTGVLVWTDQKQLVKKFTKQSITP